MAPIKLTEPAHHQYLLLHTVKAVLRCNRYTKYRLIHFRRIIIIIIIIVIIIIIIIIATNKLSQMSHKYSSLTKKIKINKRQRIVSVKKQRHLRSNRQEIRKGERKSKKNARICMVMVIRFNMFNHYYTTGIAYNDV